MEVEMEGVEERVGEGEEVGVGPSNIIYIYV